MSPQRENFDGSRTRILPAEVEIAEYSPEERATLLRLAHESIRLAREGTRIDTEAPTGHLAEPRGAFTTLYVAHQRRRCVGHCYPVSVLYQAIADTACPV